MPRYFFNLRHRPGPAGLAVDPEGDELADLQAAREYALTQARDMITRTRTDLVRDWMVCSFEILDDKAANFIEMTADVVSAYVSNNSVRPADMAELIASTHAALARLGQNAPSEAPAVEKPTPAQIRKSVTPDALISFIDGKPYKTLKRHLTGNGMTIEQYRQRYGLPRGYPSAAAGYSEQRSSLAKSLGLGQQRRKAAPKAAEPERLYPSSRSGLVGRGRRKCR